MKHIKRRTISDINPYEIIEVELLPENTLEENQMYDIGAGLVEEYLSVDLQAVDIIEVNLPFIIIKKVKDKIGFGQ